MSDDKVLKKSSESATASEIRTALGVGPNDHVVVTTPQFTRRPGDPAPVAYPGHPVLARLHELPIGELLELGLRRWTEVPPQLRPG